MKLATLGRWSVLALLGLSALSACGTKKPPLVVDMDVDYDDIAQRLGSRRSHGHEYRFHKRVEGVISRALQGIKDGRHDRAWVIRSLPTEAERVALAAELKADVVVVDAPDDVLLERAGRRPQPNKTAAAIREWRAISHGTHNNPTPTPSAD